MITRAAPQVIPRVLDQRRAEKLVVGDAVTVQIGASRDGSAPDPLLARASLCPRSLPGPDAPPGAPAPSRGSSNACRGATFSCGRMPRAPRARSRRTSTRWCSARRLAPQVPPRPPPPPPPPRTNWTRRVPHPVLIGHAASLTPYPPRPRPSRRSAAASAPARPASPCSACRPQGSRRLSPTGF